eukprot:m.47005 g.47005  ORF g.47005 m.47005 type:complete len:317 (+) comp20394_c0_seq1:68-1018(+)
MDATIDALSALTIDRPTCGRYIPAPNKGEVYWGDADVFMKAGPVVVWGPNVDLDNFEEENVKFQHAVVKLFFQGNEENATFFMAINFAAEDVLVLTATIDTDAFLEVIVPPKLQKAFRLQFEHNVEQLNPMANDNRHLPSGPKGKPCAHDVYPDRSTSCCCDICEELRPPPEFKIFLLERQCRPVIGTRELHDSVKSRSDLRAPGEYTKRVKVLLKALKYVKIKSQGCSITYNSLHKARAKVFVVKAIIPVREFFQVYYKVLSTKIRGYRAKAEILERSKKTRNDPMVKKHEEFFNKQSSHNSAMLIYDYIKEQRA